MDNIEYAFEHLVAELEHNELDNEQKRSLYLKLRLAMQDLLV